ncbi:DUF397 domain-containing protein [Kitasatospora sp. NBC_01287]|uniref:DUF397 domain-containing protein n=1 Tax=Kitasatospora sp. NBC_01287 TaxID=2903573 RepID=UPI002252B389|nr:DUF397 domain-containing protein [Kitasatospora sp. NBC_01287]MCX4749750.1 DUF397 domain-containing protein [Kitasatospora sp. NBC_01287]
MTTTWFKSSHSGSNGGQCVEASRDLLPTGLVPVRDSKDPDGPALTFAAPAFATFVTALKSGALPTT